MQVTDVETVKIIDAVELSSDERKEFDYLDWSAIDAGTDSASLFRYKSGLYDLQTFTQNNCVVGVPDTDGIRWSGITYDTYFSGVVISHSGEDEDFDDSMIVGTWYA